MEQVEARADSDEFTVRFESRALDDIRRFDDGRQDEAPFRAAARLSEVNEGLYETFLGPSPRSLANEGSAKILRWMHPNRIAYAMFSDANPWMLGVKHAAEAVRANRAPAPADHPLRALEAKTARRAIEAIETATHRRDQVIEQVFKAIFTHPLTEALTGEAASFADGKKPARSPRRQARELAELKLAAIAMRAEHGSFEAVVLRILYAAVKASGVVDARGFAAARVAKASSDRFTIMSGAGFRREMKDAALVVAFDEDRALEALPNLLPGMDERREAVSLARRIAQWRPQIAPEVRAVLERV